MHTIKSHFAVTNGPVKQSLSDGGQQLSKNSNAQLFAVMRLHYLWPLKSQNCTIPVNLKAIQTTTITSYLGYNGLLHYIVYGLRLSNFKYPRHSPMVGILALIRYLQIYP